MITLAELTHAVRCWRPVIVAPALTGSSTIVRSFAFDVRKAGTIITVRPVDEVPLPPPGETNRDLCLLKWRDALHDDTDVLIARDLATADLIGCPVACVLIPDVVFKARCARLPNRAPAAISERDALRHALKERSLMSHRPGYTRPEPTPIFAHIDHAYSYARAQVAAQRFEREAAMRLLMSRSFIRPRCRSSVL